MFLTNKQIHKYNFWEPVIWGLEILQLVLLQFWPLDLSRYRDRTARSVPKSLAAFCKNLKLIEGFIALFTPSERLGLFSLCQQKLPRSHFFQDDQAEMKIVFPGKEPRAGSCVSSPFSNARQFQTGVSEVKSILSQL